MESHRLNLGNLLLLTVIASAPMDFARSMEPGKSKSTVVESFEETTFKTYRVSDEVQIRSEAIEFEQADYSLPPAVTKSMQNMLAINPENLHKISVHIAAWSDQELPNSGDLSRADKKLAEDRLNAIYDVVDKVKPIRKYELKVYNMAENPGFMSRIFNSPEQQLKHAVNSPDVNSLEKLPKEFQLIIQEGGPSRSVVVLRAEWEKKLEDATAH